MNNKLENLKPVTPEYTITKENSKENIDNLRIMFADAERVFEAEGREGAKPLLADIYEKFQKLNKTYKLEDEEWERVKFWNAEGYLTEAEFNELNLRRKKLSNAIGIMTASGEVRHDLNEI